MFIEKPHLPERDVSLFLIDKNAENVKLDNLIEAYGHDNLLSGIDSHPDMTFCPLYNGECVVAKEAFDYYSEMLSPYGLKVISGENDISENYPYDIAYNCVLLNGKLFHNIKYTDRAIIKYCDLNNIELVNVKQGYTKCSTLIVNEKSVITCDKKLNEVYLKHGISSLYVNNRSIRIRGFDHGFIGGCGGKISKNKIAFFGDLKTHIDFIKIEKFLNERGIDYVSLCDGILYDYGTLIPLNCQST